MRSGAVRRAGLALLGLALGQTFAVFGRKSRVQLKRVRDVDRREGCDTSTCPTCASGVALRREEKRVWWTGCELVWWWRLR